MDPLTLGVRAVVLLIASCRPDEEGKRDNPDRPLNNPDPKGTRTPPSPRGYIEPMKKGLLQQVKFRSTGPFASVPLEFFSGDPKDSEYYSRFREGRSIGEPLASLRHTKTRGNGNWGETYPSYSNPNTCSSAR